MCILVTYVKSKIVIKSKSVHSFNGDMIPDVFGVTEPKQLTEVCYLTKR